MEEYKKCVQCGNTDKLFELKNGKFVCKKCADALGKEQREIQEHITEYLSENFQIINPETQAKILEALALCIRYDYGILNKEKIDKINREKERMDKAFE